GSRGRGGDERDVDLRLQGRGKFVFGALRALPQALQAHPVRSEVDAVLGLELLGQLVDEDAVEIFATQVGVAAGCLDVEYPIGDLQHGDVEGAATEVIDRDQAGTLFV